MLRSLGSLCLTCLLILSPAPVVSRTDPLCQVSQATLNGAPLPDRSVHFNAPLRLNVLTFENVMVPRTAGTQGAVLCFTSNGSTCGSLAQLCNNSYECKYTVWSDMVPGQPLCCPVSLLD